MTTRIPGRAAPFVALAAFLCGCEAVPTLTFQPPVDAASDTADETRPPADAGPGRCADPDSGQPYTCCGTVACAGGACTALCDMCISKCTPPEYCCANQMNVVCKPAGMLCH